MRKILKKIFFNVTIQSSTYTLTNLLLTMKKSIMALSATLLLGDCFTKVAKNTI
jgi:hypothetical protein